jgi:hypothetical protein
MFPMKCVTAWLQSVFLHTPNERRNIPPPAAVERNTFLPDLTPMGARHFFVLGGASRQLYARSYGERHSR